MPRLVSWPMYAVDGRVTAAFLDRLRDVLAEAGFDPVRADAPGALVAHWLDPALLLSQTCGFPLVTSLLGRVRYVATPRFAVEGCAGASYRSAVVVRRGDPARSLADMAGRRIAFNGPDSQSGTNGLRALVAPHARAGRFFGGRVETGSHRASLHAVAAGMADVAAIDVVTLALLAECEPGVTDGVRILCHTALVPGLPLITAAGTSQADLARLRRAVAHACSGEAPAARALHLDGVAVLPPEAYGIIAAQRDAAGRLGYPELA